MERQIGIGLVLTIATVALLGFYFIYEPTLQQQQAELFRERTLETGARLFAAYCTLCHGNQGEGVPGLGLPVRNTTLEDDVLYKIIARGRPLALSSQVPKPQKDMPAWSNEEGGSLKKNEIEDIVFFLKNWEQAVQVPAGADPARGQQLFLGVGCAACHGQKAEGGLNGLAPKLAGTPLSVNLLRNQIRHPRGQMLRYDERTLPDKDIEHIYAWLQSLR